MRLCFALVNEVLTDTMQAVALDKLVRFGLAKTIIIRARK